MNETTQKRIKDADLILCKIQDEGLDEHKGLLFEALEYFLLDVLQDEEFERLKKEYKIK